MADGPQGRSAASQQHQQEIQRAQYHQQQQLYQAQLQQAQAAVQQSQQQIAPPRRQPIYGQIGGTTGAGGAGFQATVSLMFSIPVNICKRMS